MGSGFEAGGGHGEYGSRMAERAKTGAELVEVQASLLWWAGRTEKKGSRICKLGDLLSVLEVWWGREGKFLPEAAGFSAPFHSIFLLRMEECSIDDDAVCLHPL